MDINTITLGETLTKTYGDKTSGTVEAINYRDNTIDLWDYATDTLTTIHTNGITR